MRIQIDIRRPRWLRAPRTWGARAFLTLLLAGAVAVPVAWASHQFGDVPETNPHHEDVSAIFGARITQGCNPPANDLYCPDHFVRRDQMASFLQRGLGRAALGGDSEFTALTAAESDIAVLDVTTGGTDGGTGFIVVNATANGFLPAGESSLPSLVAFRIVRDAGGESDEVYETAMPTTVEHPHGFVSAAQTWVFPVATGTVETLRLKAWIQEGPGPINARGRLSAIYVPFGSAGGAVLGGDAAAVTP
jgi:hypothetical protein